jgi:hypothetical protein
MIHETTTLFVALIVIYSLQIFWVVVILKDIKQLRYKIESLENITH